MNSNAERIVVGVDGSPGSRAALHWAARYGQKVGGTVDAMTVWRVGPPFADQLGKPDEDYEREAREHLDAAVAELQRIEPHCPVQASLQRGKPVDVLLNHARKADLSVLGDKGRTPAGLLMGSVVTDFLRHAPCPVVLVRATANTATD